MNLSPYRTTVIATAGSTEMTTVETVKRELGITDGGNDDKFLAWIQQHSAAAVRYLDRKIAKETVLDVFRADWPSGNGSGVLMPVDALMLSRCPVATITSVVENGTTLDPDADFEIVEGTGELWRLRDDTQACWANAKISVTYVGGWQMIDELPQDLERAVIIMVKGSFFSSARDPYLKQVSVPGVAEASYWVGSMGENSAIPPEALALLDLYRLISI